MITFLDFEKPIAELEAKILELRSISDESVNIDEEVGKLQNKATKMLTDTYKKLSAWQKTQVARHPDRPHFTDYIKELIDDFTPLAGDRGFAEDTAIIGGLGRFQNRAVMIMGHEKGTGTEGRLEHNFGMARPEGYRKAIRLMKMADRFKLPVITLVDTPGAYPGIGAEERGQAEAIARSTEACLSIGVPLVSCIIGEGGSGGAVALATANQVIMLEHAIYSVITPEGCASILWRNAAKAQDAAEALKLTAADLKKLKVIDDIVKEPIGGAHRKPKESIAAVGKAISKALNDLSEMTPDELRNHRRRKFLEIGAAGVQ